MKKLVYPAIAAAFLICQAGCSKFYTKASDVPTDGLVNTSQFTNLTAIEKKDTVKLNAILMGIQKATDKAEQGNCSPLRKEVKEINGNDPLVFHSRNEPFLMYVLDTVTRTTSRANRAIVECDRLGL